LTLHASDGDVPVDQNWLPELTVLFRRHMVALLASETMVGAVLQTDQ